MGIKLSRLYGQEETRILMENSGKTTILYKLKLGEVVDTRPTVGFNIETVSYKDITFTIWDIGSGENWQQYYQNTLGIIFVVDSTWDLERFKNTAKQLESMLSHDQLRNSSAPLLVLNNKIEKENAKQSSLVVDLMNLEAICSCNKKKWTIQSTSAITDDGLYQGLDWLMNAIRGKV
ncbi:hypothetical protein CYY_006344 [Polysphondylium violaceum]|uniref:ARF-like protein n=1 Tax=Polysphondylium violaceum TaxID=133409 RepID=A0A8J4PTN6_9MYCE|nr:hypothetical protein CYY_006344 [Polysphondylium violaceum]